jgi:hypothetical protein
MPEHLEEYAFSEDEPGLITKLELWLANNGKFEEESAAPYFEICSNIVDATKEDEEFGKIVGKLWEKAVALLQRIHPRPEVTITRSSLVSIR